MMRPPVFLLLLVPVLACTPTSSTMAAPPPPATTAHSPATAMAGDDTWMSVVLDGRKIGHLHIRRDITADRVVTTQSLVLQLYRAGKPMAVENVIGSTETVDGQPLAFSAVTRLSAIENRVDGERLANGQFRVHAEVGGQSHVRLLNWPDGALLAEGQRLAMRDHGLATGTRYQLRNFDPASQHVVNVEDEVLGREPVEMPGGTQQLTHVRQTLRLARSPQSMDLWLDDDYRIRKGSMRLLGFRLDMLACGRDCALAPDQNVDLLRDTLTEAPRPLTPNLRNTQMRYVIRIRDHADVQLIGTSEQHPTRIDDGLWLLDVGNARRAGEAPPKPSDTAANDWLQSDSPQIRELAQRIVGKSKSDRRRMQKLKEFVGGHIDNKGLGIGYASALETLKTREGDCTEHAVLLAALARSLDIPARVATGMVYADRFAGRNRVFVPHAWVQAWIDGRWISYDAALGHFDSTHIALALGDGDPWKYFAGLNLLGHIRIDKATPIAGLLDFGAPSAPAPAPTGDGGGR